MYVVHSYSLAVVFCVITMFCWGSWANARKLAPAGWRFELFYWDYALGVLLITLILGATLGTLSSGGPPFFARSAAGRPGQHRPCALWRRGIQPGQHPAGGRHRGRRHGGGLSGRHRAGAGAGCHPELRGGPGRQSRPARDGRGAGDTRDHSGCPRLSPAGGRRGTHEREGPAAVARLRSVHGSVLPLCRRGDVRRSRRTPCPA